MKRKILSSDFYNIELYNGAKSYCIKKLPTLYKYQSVSEYSLTNLSNGEIWGTIPKAFNDPYDSSCCYTYSLLKKAIITELNKDRLDCFRIIFKTKSKEKIITNLLCDLINYTNEPFKNNYCVSCFSIYNDSEIMWAHYADTAKGFVIEYNGLDLYNCAKNSREQALQSFKKLDLFNIDLPGNENDLAPIMPIIYSTQKYNISNRLIKLLPKVFKCYDKIFNGIAPAIAINDIIEDLKQQSFSDLKDTEKIFYSVMSNKSKCWSYEQEWRIWSYNTNVLTGNISSPYVKIGIAPARAIYLGENISKFNRIILLQIAKELKIPIYQMRTKAYKSCYKLEPVLIENN